MNSYSYPISLKQEGHAFVVTVPDIPEVTTNGYSKAEACEYAQDAIAMVLGEYIRREMPIPAPSKPKRGMVMIDQPADVQERLARYEETQTLKDKAAKLNAVMEVLAEQRDRIERDIARLRPDDRPLLEPAQGRPGMRKKKSRRMAQRRVRLVG